jgi:hypothetical protein
MERFQRLIPIEKLVLPLAFALFAAIIPATLFGGLGIVTPETLDDPFLAYADVFPGQPGSAAIARDFVCNQVTLPSSADVSEVCIYYPLTGPFSQVNVMVWDGLIVGTNFSIRERTMTMGDLILWWGDAELSSAGEWGMLRWGEQCRIATGHFPNGRYTHFSPVSHVLNGNLAGCN